MTIWAFAGLYFIAHSNPFNTLNQVVHGPRWSSTTTPSSESTDTAFAPCHDDDTNNTVGPAPLLYRHCRRRRHRHRRRLYPPAPRGVGTHPHGSRDATLEHVSTDASVCVGGTWFRYDPVAVLRHAPHTLLGILARYRAATTTTLLAPPRPPHPGNPSAFEWILAWCHTGTFPLTLSPVPLADLQASVSYWNLPLAPTDVQALVVTIPTPSINDHAPTAVSVRTADGRNGHVDGVAKTLNLDSPTSSPRPLRGTPIRVPSLHRSVTTVHWDDCVPPT